MTDAASRPFVLIAACCNWPRKEAGIETIRQASREMDWGHALRLVAFHRVAGLVCDGLHAAAIAPPPAILSQLTAAAAQTARISLRLAVESVRLQALCDQAGIAVLFLKGAALGQRAYASVGIKQSWDIDILVTPGDIESIVCLLERNGYAFTHAYQGLDRRQLRYLVHHIKEVPMRHGESGLVVEVTWRPSGNVKLFALPTPALDGQAIPLPGLGVLRTMKDADLLIYLSVHGAGHAWSRLKWLADFHALLGQFTPPSRAMLQERARLYGSAVCFAQALMLCEHIFATPLADAHPGGWRQSARLTYLTHVARTRLTRPAPADLAADRIFSGAAARWYSFRLGQGWAFFREQCRIACVQGTDVLRFPLPPALYFLYPVLRVPFYLWRRLIKATRKTSH